MARPARDVTNKVEEVPAIDIARLRGDGYREDGASGRIAWRRRDHEFASVSFRLMSDGLRLSYTQISSDGSVDVVDLIPIVTTRTRFGGIRHWFECPACGRRCRKVHGGSRFRCRRCHGLRYQSQYEWAPIGIARRRWAVRECLDRGGREWSVALDDGFPPKPRRMHWRTYERLITRDAELKARCWTAVRARLDETDTKGRNGR